MVSHGIQIPNIICSSFFSNNSMVHHGDFNGDDNDTSWFSTWFSLPGNSEAIF